MKKYLLGCDWGTSSFRLRLIDQQTQTLVDQVTSDEGVSKTFTAWKKKGEAKDISRDQFFLQYLRQQINLLAEKVGLELEGVSIVISGMASSSLGMDELPYALLPFPVDGSRASVKRFEAQNDFPHDVLLISGVCSDFDVMRGEETQLIGLMALLDSDHYPVSDTIILFPGTHSKHIYVQSHQVVDFQTFMTGEVYNLMTHHSILKDSVSVSRTIHFSTNEIAAFKAGIHELSASVLLNSLFRVRTNQLFNKLSKRENAYYLSGLLIGSELKTLVDKKSWQLILCSNSNLYELYKITMQELGLSDRTTTISADYLDRATISGQLKILQNQLIQVNK